MRKTLIINLLTILAMAVCGNLWAEDTPPQWYQIELIVFKQPQENSTGHEHWPRLTGELSLADAIVLQPSLNELPSQAYVGLPANALALKQEEKSLSKQNRTEVLLHTGWLQPIEPQKKAQMIYLHNDNDLRYSGLSLLNEDTPQDTEKDHLWGLEGLVSVKRQRYFHLNTNIILREVAREPNTDDVSLFSSDREGLRTYRIKADTRLRSNELHYIDHPQFGVLVKIMPVETPSIMGLEDTEEPRLELDAG